MNRFVQIILIILLLFILFDPSMRDIKRSAGHFSHLVFGTDNSQPANNEHFNNYTPEQSTFDSTEILQGIDSIESASKQQQEIIDK
jgi:hypothetical protein